MTGKALLHLEKRQLICDVKLVSLLVVKRRRAMRQAWSRIRDVVVRSCEAPDRRTTCEELRIQMEQFRIGIAGLELQAMAHVLLGLDNQRVIVRTHAVRAVVKASIERVRAKGAEARPRCAGVEIVIADS